MDRANDFIDTIEDISDIEPGFYNLLIIDANGCVTTTDSIEVTDETVGISITPKLNVRVYPNPARNQLYIDLTEDMQYQIQLMSMQGILVDQWKDAKVLNVSEIIPGSYILKITSNDKVFIQRLIIAR
jgi:hypothetical protein